MPPRNVIPSSPLPILIADADEARRTAFSSALRDAGFNVAELTDPGEAFSKPLAIVLADELLGGPEAISWARIISTARMQGAFVLGATSRAAVEPKPDFIDGWITWDWPVAARIAVIHAFAQAALTKLGKSALDTKRSLATSSDLELPPSSDEWRRRIFESSSIGIWEEDFSGVFSRITELRTAGVTDLAAHLDRQPAEIEHLASLIRIISISDAALRILQCETKEEAMNGFPRFFAPGTMPLFKHEIISLASGESQFDCEAPMISAKGKPLWLKLSVRASSGCSSAPACVLVSCIDITAQRLAVESLRRANRALKVLTESNQAVVRANSEEKLLHNICQIAVEKGGYLMAWVGYAEQDEAKTIRPVARFGHDDGYVDIVKANWDAWNERGRGPFGAAIRTGRPSVCRDVTTGPDYGPWRASALARGYASSIVLPLMAQGRAFGSLAIYASEVGRFDEEEVNLLMELADDLAVGIALLRSRLAHQESEVSLRDSEERYRAIFSTARDALMINSATQSFDCNEAALKLFGFAEKSEFLRQHPSQLSPSLQPSGETSVDAARRELEIALARGTNSFEWVHQRKDGSTFPAEVLLSCFESHGQRLIQAIVRDISERKRAEAAQEVQTRLARGLLELPRIAEQCEETEFIQRAQDLAEDLTGSKISFLYFVDAESETVELVSRSRSTNKRRCPLREAGTWIDSLHQGRPVVFNDYTSLSGKHELPVEHADLTRLISVPTFENGQPVMLMGAGNKEANYTEQDVKTVQLISETIWRIVQRRRSEAITRDATSYLTALIQASPLGIVSYSSSGKAQTANDAAARCVGATIEQMLAQNFREIPSWKESGMLAVAERALATGAPAELETHVHTTFGRDTWFSLQFARFRRGDEWHLLMLVADVDARKRQESQLELQGSALKSAANSIVITDTAGIICYVNPAFVSLTGYTEAEAVGQNLRLLKSGEHPPELYQQLWKTITRGNVWHGELRNRRKNGDLYDEDMTITPVKDWSGKITHYIAIKQDITEKKLLEKQYLRVQRMESVGLLASGIAHDLNNVLGPILMGLELLQFEKLSPPMIGLLDSMTTSAERGAAIVKQVLTFARGTEGERAPVQLRHLVSDMVRMASETFPRNITVTSRLTADLWPVKADPTQLHQVLLNLSLNARDAMSQGGQLTFDGGNIHLDELEAAQHAGAKVGDYVRLEVADAGSGMPPEVIDRIFEPFFTTKPQGVGTGLGLPTVLGIVRSHEGFIEVKSMPNEGTTFEVWLPADSCSFEQTAGEPRVLLDGQGETILVVEDEVSLLAVTRRLLTNHHYNVIGAEDGIAAITIYAQRGEEIDLVLTDVMMPTMDGVALVRALRKINPLVKVITTTGLSSQPGQPDRRDELEALGIERQLDKPCNAETLLKALREELHPKA